MPSVAHLVAINLPSFGHSERRGSLLLPGAMREFVVRVMDECGLRNAHRVGPDVGTACSAVRRGAPSWPHALPGALATIESYIFRAQHPPPRHSDAGMLIIAGARVRAVPPTNGEFLRKPVPNSGLEILDSAHLHLRTRPTSTPRWSRDGGRKRTFRHRLKTSRPPTGDFVRGEDRARMV